MQRKYVACNYAIPGATLQPDEALPRYAVRMHTCNVPPKGGKLKGRGTSSGTRLAAGVATWRQRGCCRATCLTAADTPPIIERAVVVLSSIDKMLFLRRVAMFSSMSLEQLRVLTSHLEEQHFLAGEVIFAEGDFSQELYIVATGQVRIVKDYKTAHERTFTIYGPGDFFGDMAIFEGAPRSATAVTEAEAELLVLGPEKFKQTIYQKPDMAFEIFRELSERLRRREAEVN